MPGSPPSAMLSKWSSKSPKQKATRIRNNQRRHRAKVKAHISSLEDELTQTQRRLIAAEHRITALTAEVERLLNEARREFSLASVASVTQSLNSPMPPTVLESPCCGHSIYRRQLDISSSYERNAAVDHLFDTPTISNSTSESGSSPLSGINIGNGTEMDDSTLTIAFVAQYDCQSLPPPEPDESTTNCIAAYRIIEQQNFKRVEMEAIHQWLQSGYRRATRPGGGCTVVNSLLYSLINYLSPV